MQQEPYSRGVDLCHCVRGRAVSHCHQVCLLSYLQPSVCLPVCLLVCLSVHLSVSTSKVCLATYRQVSVCLSACLPVCLSVCLCDHYLGLFRYISTIVSRQCTWTQIQKHQRADRQIVVDRQQDRPLTFTKTLDTDTGTRTQTDRQWVVSVGWALNTNNWPTGCLFLCLCQRPKSVLLPV